MTPSQTKEEHDDPKRILMVVKTIYFGPQANSVITPLLKKLGSALPHSKISDLIFWNDPELTSEQVMDEAMKREAEYIAEHGFGSH